MRKIIMVIILAAVSSYANAYNKGLICITYLSKDGTLKIHNDNKFKESDLHLIIDYIKNTFHVEKIETMNHGPMPFARGLTDDKGLYPKIRVVNEELYFQNGIFYYERSQDSTSGMMEQFSKVIGGKMDIKCIPIKQI